MTGEVLYLRLRSAGLLCGTLAAIAGINALLGEVTFGAGSKTPLTVPLFVIFPAFMAAAILVLRDTSAAGIDALASRDLRTRGLLLDVAVVAAAAALLLVSTPSPISAEVSWVAGVRNLIGLTGLGWAVGAFGRAAPVAWIAPVVLSLVAATLGLQSLPLNDLWTWLLAPDAKLTAWLIAGFLAAVGLVLRRLGHYTTS